MNRQILCKIKRFVFFSFMFLSLLHAWCFAGPAKKIVLTGGPGVGKTTLLHAFQKQGFTIVPETATELINEAIAKGIPNPAYNPEFIAGFQENIWHRQVAKEAALPDGTLAFLDRSLLDGIAYSKFYSSTPHPDLCVDAAHAGYPLVFILDFLDIYEVNEGRQEGVADAQRLHGLIFATYQEYGYVLDENLIRVPAFLYDDSGLRLSIDASVARRVAFILEKINMLD